MRRWWMVLLAALVVALLVRGCETVQIVQWVGSTDLEVEFAVTDFATGSPIPGARVNVHSEGGFYSEDFAQDFMLTSDSDGAARKVCLRSMCFGTQGRPRRADTFVVHLPYWHYRVGAEGYERTAWTDLDVLELRRQVQRLGPGKAKLVVPVLLDRKRD